MPKLDKKVEKDWLEWAKLLKERSAWAIDVRKMRKLKVDVVELEKSITQLHSIHQAELERKYAFCEVEKARVATEL